MITEELSVLKKKFAEVYHIPPVEAFVGRKEMLDLCEEIPGFGYAVDFGLANVGGMTVRMCRKKSHLSVASGANSINEANRIYVGTKRIPDLPSIQLEDGVYLVPVRTVEDFYLLVAKAITKEKE